MSEKHYPTRIDNKSKASPVLDPIAIASDPGPRENYEDAAGAWQIRVHGIPLEATALVVLDGVGGENFGELASRLCLQRLSGDLAAGLIAESFIPDFGLDRLEPVLREAMRTANETLGQVVKDHPEFGGMATTVVAAVIIANEAIVGWAGDSRAYRIGTTGIERLTRDHSKRQDLLKDGTLTAEQIQDHPMAHCITNYLDGRSSFAPDLKRVLLEPGDLLVVATDGLMDVVSDEVIEAEAQAARRAPLFFADLPGRLVRRALAVGTTDNCTVLTYLHEPNKSVPALSDSQTRTGAFPKSVAARHFKPVLDKEQNHE